MAHIDKSILDRWLTQRDAEAFRDIVVCYSGMVYGTCRRIVGDATEAEDVTQESFEALAQAKRAPAAHLGPWLHRVATNLALKHVRSEGRRKGRERSYAAEHAAITVTEWADIQAYVDHAIAEMPDKLRIPIIAYFFENDSQIAIATRLGVSQQTISHRIKRGVARIGKSLRNRGISVPSTVLATMLVDRLAEASIVPASLATALGRIALAQPAKPFAASVLGGTLPLGALYSVKSYVALIVAAAFIGSLWMMQGDGPESGPSTYETQMQEVEGALSPSDGENTASEPLPPEAQLTEEPVAFAEQSEPVVLTASELTQKAVITGRVYDVVTGVGIEGAELTASSEVWEKIAVSSGEEGMYKLTGLSRNTSWQMGIEAPGYGFLVSEPILFPTQDDLQDVDLGLGEPATIQGTVVDTNGRAVGNAEIRLSPRPIYRSSPPLPSAKAGSGGGFVIEGVGPGEYGFWVSFPDSQETPTRMALNETLQVAFGDDLRNVEVIVAPVDAEEVVAGLVTDEFGEAIAEVSVRTVNRKELGRTDAEGWYQVTAMSDGISSDGIDLGVSLEFWREGYSGVRLTNLAPGTTDTNVVLLRKGGLAGIVHDGQTGGPLKTFTVAITKFSGGDQIGNWRFKERFESDEGAFTISDLPPGFATVEVSAPGLAPQVFTSVRIESGHRTDGLEFKLYPGGEVLGKVVEASSGRPVASAKVYLIGGTGRIDVGLHEKPRFVTSSDGSFAIENVSPEFHRIAVVHPDFAPALHSVEVRSRMTEDTTIRLGVGGGVEGRVFLDGQPWDQLPVLLSGPMTGTSRHSSQTTDDDGYFHFDKLLEADYSIVVGLRGVGTQNPVVVVKDGFWTEKIFEFFTGDAVIEGNVTFADIRYGTASGHVMVFIDVPDGRQYIRGDLRDGFYHMPGLPAGDHRLEAYVFNPNVNAPGGMYCHSRDADELVFPSYAVHLKEGEAIQFDIEIADAWLAVNESR